MEESQTFHESKGSRTDRIAIRTDPEGLSNWFPLLWQGFLVETRLGRNMRQVLCEQMGLSPEYLEKRVQTVFLDGKAIDDLDSSVLDEGCVVALSAAMPGFVGAAYRKGGYYRGMRSGTTYRSHALDSGEKPGLFGMKLFNLVADELGESFLQGGILVDSTAFAQFLEKQPESFWQACRDIRFNGEPVHADSLLSMRAKARGRLVFLQVLASQ